ncbi:hypothetical protein INT43_001258 [Umbelopsis isabellina]|uniref:Uncharacterized protein n=1 Tax=Mortierella isabellina TaxID=91625 RepID=A0A8H7U8A0_MORIS|nr:hypothetical protein INT43_001258 [Umbelopsis isabellina]
MTSAFKKRSRSTSTASSTQPEHSKILVAKLNKLRSTSLALFSRIASSVNSTTPRQDYIKRERSFSFATPTDPSYQHRNLDTLVRDPRLLGRVNKYRSTLSVDTPVIEEPHLLTVSNDPSDNKRYDNVYQAQWRAAQDYVKADTLRPPVAYPQVQFMKGGLTEDANPEMTVKSEELTAREFADMTGIKIISDDEPDDDTHVMDRVETRASGLTADRVHQSTITTTSSVHSADTHACSIKCKPQIWDSGFWQKPESCMAQCSPCEQIPIQAIHVKIDDKPRPNTLHTSTASSEDTTSTLFTCNTASSCSSSVDSDTVLSRSQQHDSNKETEAPFISNLRRASCTSNVKRNEQGGVVIKKGRFHICLGDTQDTDIPSSTEDDTIREWKRKSIIPNVADDNTLKL